MGDISANESQTRLFTQLDPELYKGYYSFCKSGPPAREFNLQAENPGWIFGGNKDWAMTLYASLPLMNISGVLRQRKDDRLDRWRIKLRRTPDREAMTSRRVSYSNNLAFCDFDAALGFALFKKNIGLDRAIGFFQFWIFLIFSSIRLFHYASCLFS